MGLFGKLQDLLGDAEDEREIQEEGSTELMSRPSERAAEQDASRKGNKVVNIHATAQLQVV